MKKKTVVGDIASIPLGDGHRGFGWVLGSVLMAFFDYRDSISSEIDGAKLAEKPLLFRIWVIRRAIADGDWPVVGHASVPPDVLEPPWFFKRDPITKKLSITRTGAEEVKADAKDCAQLECAAVWDPVHVADRLRDHFAGRPNKWVEALRVRDTTT